MRNTWIFPTIYTFFIVSLIAHYDEEITKFFGIGMIIIAFISSALLKFNVYTQTRYYFSNRSFKWLYILLIVMFISGIFTPKGLLPGVARYIIFCFMLFYFIIIKQNYINQVNNYINFFCITTILLGLVAAIVAWLIYFNGSFSIGFLNFIAPKGGSERLTGWFGSANRFGTIMGIASLTLYFYIFLFRRDLKVRIRFFLIIMFLFFLVSLMFSGSKGSTMAFLAGFIVAFYNSLPSLLSLRFYKTILLYLFLVISVIFTLSAAMTFLGFSWQYYLDFIFRTDVQQNMTRWYIWERALDFFNNQSAINKFFGSGTGAFYATENQDAHNGYLNGLIDYGVIYIFFFFRLIINTYSRLLKQQSSKSKPTYISFLLGLLTLILIRDTVNSGLLSNTIETFYFIWIIFMSSIYGWNPKKPIQKAPQKKHSNAHLKSNLPYYEINVSP